MIRVFTHPDCLAHRAPAGYPETPERLRAILDHLGGRVDIDDEARVGASDVERAIAAVQDEAYVERLKAAVERGDGLIDSADNPLSPDTWRSARAAVAAVLASLDWTLAEPGRRAFAAVRPPGHHAGADYAMGFCYLSNVAIAAQYLLDRHGLERVAILDFDVHHGNGTQDVFYERGDVLYLSVHQYPFYPGTGRAQERGRGDGEGATLNVPLSAGRDDDDYARVFDDELLPAIDRFAPDMILVSAGFDAWRGDPLGGMRVGLEGFESWGRELASAAERHGEGRLWSILEGGYDVPGLGPIAAAYLAGQGLETASEGTAEDAR